MLLSLAKKIYIKLTRFKYWRSLKRHNMQSIKFDKRILVFESDDWGGIRVPSRGVYDELLKSGEKMYKDPYLHYDCLESKEDLNELCSTLQSFADKRGRHPCFTANFVMCNPAFDKIDTEAGVYCRESMELTYQSYYGENIIHIVKEWCKKGIIAPQLHCLEHLKCYDWINSLKEGDESVSIAFHKKMIGVYSTFSSDKYGYMDVLNYSKHYEEDVFRDLKQASNAFNSCFGFSSESFAPPCFVWRDDVLNELHYNGVNFIQAGINQFVPENGTFIKRHHYTGEVLDNGLIITTRNCFLEPVYFLSARSAAAFCFKQIRIAFEQNAPAIVDTHRMNYVGGLFPSNRKKGNKALKILLKKVLKKYPDTSFLSSIELHKMIKNSLSKSREDI